MLKIMLLALAFLSATPVFCGGPDEGSDPQKDKKREEEVKKEGSLQPSAPPVWLDAARVYGKIYYDQTKAFINKKADEYGLKGKSPWLATGAVVLCGCLVLKKAVLPFCFGTLVGFGAELVNQEFCNFLARKAGYTDLNNNEAWFAGESGSLVKGLASGTILGFGSYLRGGGIIFPAGLAIGQAIGQSASDPYLKKVVYYNMTSLTQHIPFVKDLVQGAEGSIPSQYTLREAGIKIAARITGASAMACVIMAVLKVK